MLVLALDTATPVPALAIAGDRFEGEVRLPEGHHVSEALLPCLSDLLGRSGAALSEVDRIVACAGPGSFTGIRVGVATAWGLSRTLRIPLEAVDSLEAIAETARSSGSRLASACLDAERGEAYVETFDLSGPRAAALAPPRIVSAAAVGALPGVVIRLPGRELADSPALAAARAVVRSPGAATSIPRAIYVRASAAEEFHGVPRA